MAGLNRTASLTTAVLVLTAVAWGGSANAQFIGMSADVAIAYSATNVTAKSLSGGSIGITHPIPLIPNIGGSALAFTDTETSSVTSPSSSKLNLVTKVKLQTINFFYHIPFPVVTMVVGVGFGTIKTSANADLDSSTEDLSDKGNVTEGFIHIGLPFYNMLEFHLGYHVLSPPQLDRPCNAGPKVVGEFLYPQVFVGSQNLEQDLEPTAVQFPEGWDDLLSLKSKVPAHRIVNAHPGNEVGHAGSPTADALPCFAPVNHAAAFHVTASHHEVRLIAAERLQHLRQEGHVMLQICIHDGHMGGVR